MNEYSDDDLAITDTTTELQLAQNLHRLSGSRLTWDQLDGEARNSFINEAAKLSIRHRAILAARMTGSDVELAKALHLADSPRTDWDNLTGAEKRHYLIQAYRTTDLDGRQEREVVAHRTKMAAVDAYRASIVTTVPAHRLDTRQNGFLDGWDAAMAYIKAEREAGL